MVVQVGLMDAPDQCTEIACSEYEDPKCLSCEDTCELGNGTCEMPALTSTEAATTRDRTCEDDNCIRYE